ncbi:hypothetical protein LP092_15435 (plasmid) [Moraxella bovis]|uniref:Transglycosylase SLT domain-containing protein n=1 Tax=Moraxella bovis TaxID=476 RepID=A0ABY6MCB1_MORBO|nr:hypothetical protein [Moraxella bovis]UZA04758.1 hypothetical protein LP092_15435 [Moraxella bovis]
MNTAIKLTIIGLLSLYSLPSFANQEHLNPAIYPYGKPTLQCVHQAANHYNITLPVMLAVQSIERGKTNQLVQNQNGSYDIGAFQINSIHLERIKQLGGSQNDLANRGCYNAVIAALFLFEAINHPKKQHLDFYSRAAGYHSWTPKFNQIYRAKLIDYTKQWERWLAQNYRH